MQIILKQIRYYLKNYGLKKTIKKINSKIYYLKNKSISERQYKIWISNNEPNNEILENQRNTNFKIKPKFSIVVPMYNTPINFFKELVDCLKNQTYSNWELCLADGSPKRNEKLKEIIEKDSRIKYKFLNQNKGISENTNEALKLVTRRLYSIIRP